MNAIAMQHPQRSASVRGHGRVDQIRSSDLDLTTSKCNGNWYHVISPSPFSLQVPTTIHNEMIRRQWSPIMFAKHYHTTTTTHNIVSNYTCELLNNNSV